MTHVIPNPPLVCSECMTERFQWPYVETVTVDGWARKREYSADYDHEFTDRVRREAVYTCENGHVTRRALGWW